MIKRKPDCVGTAFIGKVTSWGREPQLAGARNIAILNKDTSGSAVPEVPEVPVVALCDWSCK